MWTEQQIRQAGIDGELNHYDVEHIISVLKRSETALHGEYIRTKPEVINGCSGCDIEPYRKQDTANEGLKKYCQTCGTKYIYKLKL